MPIAATPDCCPACREPFPLSYAVFRSANMSMQARVALLGGAILGLAVFGALVLLLGQLLAELSAALFGGRGWIGLYVLACLVAAVVAVLPVWASWWYAFRCDRVARLTCGKCGWSGAVSVADVTAPLGPLSPPVQTVHVTEYEGMPPVTDGLAARRARQQELREKERRRRRAQEAEGEAGPNPDFDFR